MKTGIELIAGERAEQIEKHGRSVNLDALQNDLGQIGFAIVSLCSEHDATGRNVASIPGGEKSRIDHFTRWKSIGWNLSIWLKMISKPYKERLIIAGALAAAELDRLQFIENEKSEQ